MVFGGAVGACAPSSLCDPGQVYSNGICYAVDAAPSAIDADPRFAHFGDVCSIDPDCALPNAYCVKLPGETTGYCTGTGCLTDPDVCPSAWSCVDLSVYQAGLPSICVKP